MIPAMLCITKMHFCDSQVICTISVFHAIIIHAEFNDNKDLLIEYIAGFWIQIQKNFISQNCENTTQFDTITMHVSIYIYIYIYIYQHMTGKPSVDNSSLLTDDHHYTDVIVKWWLDLDINVCFVLIYHSVNLMYLYTEWMKNYWSYKKHRF